MRPCFPPEGPKAFRAGLIQVRASKTAGRDFSNSSICLEAHRVDLRRRVTKGPDGGTIAPRGEVALRRILGMLCNEQGGWQDCSTTDLFRPPSIRMRRTRRNEAPPPLRHLPPSHRFVNPMAQLVSARGLHTKSQRPPHLC